MLGSWFLNLDPAGLLVWPVGGQFVTLVLTGVLLLAVAGLLGMRERPDRRGPVKTPRAVGNRVRGLPSAA